jgi:hypothetical protein
MKNIILLIAAIVTLNAEAIVVVSKCDKEQRSEVFATMKKSRKDMVRQIRQLRAYKKTHELPKKIKKKVNSAIRVLRCSIGRSYITRVKCNEEDRHGAIAYTLAFIGTTIWVNPMYWSYSSNEQRGIMIHELTHKCLTGDATYFWGSKPRDVNGRAWSGIADTYRYWNNNGVCIPEIDC